MRSQLYNTTAAISSFRDQLVSNSLDLSDETVRECARGLRDLRRLRYRRPMSFGDFDMYSRDSKRTERFEDCIRPRQTTTGRSVRVRA